MREGERFFDTKTATGMNRRRWAGRLFVLGFVLAGVIYSVAGGGIAGYLFAGCWLFSLLFVYEPWFWYAKRKRRGYYAQIPVNGN